MIHTSDLFAELRIGHRRTSIFNRWGSPSIKDMARALHAILSMAHQMASDIAKYNEIPYPTDGQKATFDWLISVVIPPD